MEVSRLLCPVSAPNDGALRTKTFRWLLGNVLRPAAATTVVDLGAGPCQFSQIALEFGLAPTAVDVRDERVPDQLGKIRFIKADVRDFSPAGYNIVLVLGLLYHLTLEDQIALLSKCSNQSKLIIDTQIHIPELVVQRNNVEGFADKIVQAGDYEGVNFPEGRNPMASWGNSHSFWHTDASILRLFQNCGRECVVVVDPPYVSKYGGRRWFLC